MVRWVARPLRGTGIALVLCGGLSLLTHPGFTAPGVSTPGRTKAAHAALPSGPRPSIAPKPSGEPSPQVQKPALPATPPPGDAIMPVSEVRAGMKGYGLTVFRGTKIERFDVEVLGVLPKLNQGEPLVLVRLSGGPISQRGAFLIQGMSRSPIYIDGKLLGAFSMGNAWPKEPIGMVTPIEDMMEALDPKLSAVPAGQTAMEPLPGEIGGATTASAGNSALSATQTFHPLALPVSISGLTGPRLERAAQILNRFNMAAMQGPGTMDRPFKAELVPGAALGVALMTGDIDMTAIGTITYRKGNQILAFGHPMMQIGAAQFPITTAWIHDVFPGFQVSSKIGSAGEPCGTLTQDRAFSIAGQIGKLPTMVPIHCVIKDNGSGRTRTFNVEAANHPLLVGQLLPLAVDQALTTVRPVPGDALAHVHLKVVTDGEGTITRDNVVFDPFQVDAAAVKELAELMDVLTANSFRRVPVKSLDVEVTLEDKRPTATVERVFLAQDRFQPGEDAEVGIVVHPYHKDPVVLKTKIHVPDNAANGNAVLLVQGGATRVNLGPLLSSQPGQLPSMSPPPDASLKQVLKRWSERERNDQIVVRLIFRTAAVNINGERLSQLPSTLVDVMRSSKATGFRIERDEAKTLQNTDYVVQGVQSLEINVEKDDHQERPKSTGSRLGGQGMTAVSSSTSRGAPLSGGDDQDDLSARRSGLIPLTIDGKQQFLRLTPEEDEPEPAPHRSGKEEKPGKDAQPAEKPGDRGRGRSHDRTAPAAATPEKSGATSDTPDGTTGRAATATAVDNKLIGRPAVLWTQTSQADFERGTMSGTAVNSAGDVRLAPEMKEATASSEQFVWSVLGMGGAMYAGTGNSGQVLKVEGDRSSVFFRTGELEVHTLARDRAGNLYAGTSPNGKIFRISPDGKATELLSMNGTEPASDAGGKFVLCMATDGDDTIYAGTGPTGKIYRLRAGQTPEVLAALPAKSVTSLALGPNGALFAGTAEDGAVYRVDTATGHVHVLYDSNQSVVNGLVVDRSGSLFAALAPSGEIYRIEPDGTARLYFNKSRSPLYGLQTDASGNLYTCSGSSIYRVERDDSVTILTDRKSGQFTCLAWDDQGRMIAGSCNMGAVYRLAPATSGTFESTVHDGKLPSRWGRIRYTGSLPAGGSIAVETRSGNTSEPDATWSEWQVPESRDNGMFVASPTARFLQYRVILKAEQGTPALKDITISYLPRNQAPKLTLVTPGGGELWHGTQTLKWNATDPDSDTLTYEVSYSPDGGRTWKPVGAQAREGGSGSGTSTSGPTKSNAEEALKRYKEQLDKDPSLTPQQREQSYEKAKTLIEKYMENAPSGSSSSSSGGAPAASAGATATGVTRQAQINWDTRQVPDGVYLLRVIASDKPSNPTDALTDMRVSEPFIISNTAPQLFVFERGIHVDEQKNANVVGFVAGRVAIRGAQYRLGDGEWTAIEAEDGIWDSAFEHFRFTLPTLASGEHKLEVKVVDAAGNAADTAVKFKVP